MPDGKLKIESGVTTQMESIACRELVIEGRMTLGSSLAAEKVTVAKGGFLSSSRINAGQIEIDPGGSFQSWIEKYVPRIVPEEEKPAKVETVIEVADSGRARVGRGLAPSVSHLD